MAVEIKTGIVYAKGWGKGGFEVLTNWVELSFVVLLAFGFAAGKLIVDRNFSYMLVAAAGLIFGRLIYLRRENDPLPFHAMSIAFLIGYIFGHRIGSGLLIALIFVVAEFASYQLHKKLDFLA
ncbi:hypothetical protein HYU17_05480 [Candidatus Woesearchaeota archaeon]|nr:hypothetical protein [Candidatus Woesearchaeota archaeon]